MQRNRINRYLTVIIQNLHEYDSADADRRPNRLALSRCHPENFDFPAVLSLFTSVSFFALPIFTSTYLRSTMILGKYAKSVP